MVLPWVPPTATHDLKRISSASISARRTIGRKRLRAATSSGLSVLDRRGNDDHLGLAEVFRLVADIHRDAGLAQPRHVGVVGDVRALHL